MSVPFQKDCQTANIYILEKFKRQKHKQIINVETANIFCSYVLLSNSNQFTENKQLLNL